VSSIEDFTFNLGLTFVRGIDIKFCGTCDVPGTWDHALDLVRNGTINPESIISHTLPLDEAMKGYDLFKSREAMKVVLKP
jgi:S-(hydroxymethyl)glutathione dehydrogenase/alcohol dehydrogenase